MTILVDSRMCGMTETVENSRTEFKVKLVDELEETVIGFLNSKDGCIIYLGVNDNGKVVGLSNNLDLLQRKIKDRKYLYENNIISFNSYLSSYICYKNIIRKSSNILAKSHPITIDNIN